MLIRILSLTDGHAVQTQVDLKRRRLYF